MGRTRDSCDEVTCTRPWRGSWPREGAGSQCPGGRRMQRAGRGWARGQQSGTAGGRGSVGLMTCVSFWVGAEKPIVKSHWKPPAGIFQGLRGFGRRRSRGRGGCRAPEASLASWSGAEGLARPHGPRSCSATTARRRARDAEGHLPDTRLPARHSRTGGMLASHSGACASASLLRLQVAVLPT